MKRKTLINLFVILLLVIGVVFVVLLTLQFGSAFSASDGGVVREDSSDSTQGGYYVSYSIPAREGVQFYGGTCGRRR